MDSFLIFCSRHPALVHGLVFLMGLAFIKDLNAAFLLPFLALLIPLGWKKTSRALPFFCLFLLACLYGHLTKESHPTENSTKGLALFIPSEIKSQRSHFKQTESLKGTVVSMQSANGEKIQNVPCSIPLDSSIKRPLIYSSFYIQGSLERKGDLNFFFSFKPDPSTAWIQIPYSFSLAEWRFQAKQLLSQKIHSLFSEAKVGDLITALTIGTLEDRMLKFDFGKLGLQHILAISGFHFGLLAFFLGLFFRAFFKQRIAYVALLFFLSLYFALLGNSPSILRAYLALSLYLLSKLGKWRFSGLNILGATLFLETLLDPHVISSLGFQLSFLATFSILFLLPLCKKWMLLFFPHRTIEHTYKWPVLERWTYLFCCFLRSSFALNIAIGLSTVPVCLFHFHQFPIMSFIYNLFTPLALSLSLFLFFTSIPFFLLLPPVALFLTYLNQLFTSEILGLISQSPIYLDIYLRTPAFPLTLLLTCLISVFSLPFVLRDSYSTSSHTLK